MQTARLFVGYDPDEVLAYSVFSHSVHRRSSIPVSIQPLMLSQLKHMWVRPREANQSTDFAFTRFLVPWLCSYRGWALFADGDMVCRSDIAELWAMRDERYAVMVVQRHDYVPRAASKFLGRPDTAYPRKNWSSVMLFNNAACRALRPQYVSDASGLDLHRFNWCVDGEIGPLPAAWNHLVSVDKPNPDAKLVHFTEGMPFFTGYSECEFAKEWRAERDAMMAYSGRGDDGATLLTRLTATAA